MDSDIYKNAEIIWNYMQLHQVPKAADCMIVLGSRDERVAQYAAKLSNELVFTNIVISGGISHTQDLRKTAWGHVSEADHFARVFKENHGRDEPIVETEARNTGQNAQYVHELLAASGIQPQSLAIITKPYMERRALATFEAQWPEPGIAMNVYSQGGGLLQYCDMDQPFEVVVNIMVGDLQRIMEYPKHGFQTPQEVAGVVYKAFELLVKAGYTKHLMTK